ncbi:uncharacterized protein LOC109846169 [Asparagus officinalis]|uniref:uncharacterized protein LOC109846169 n=1 Tax=Asparagus officinalis TaxID=4686 RepID=UPI00098E4FEA|nr:uncharacterized protein LOC109846169 [Asparagus officinalis]
MRKNWGVLLFLIQIEDFKNFISSCQLTHLKSIGCYFTWNNKQEAISRIWSRLDRVLVNEEWIQNYTSSQEDFLVPNYSNHSLALLPIGEEDFGGKKPFTIFSIWINHPNFTTVVKAIWEQDIRGFHMYRLHTKLKKLKHTLKELNKQHFMNISEQVLRAKSGLFNIQNQLNNDLLNQAQIFKEKEYLNKYTRLVDYETPFYRQKANIRWVLHGDKCSQFFNFIMKAKRHHNRVLSLYTKNSEMITDISGIIVEFTEYYEKLLGVAAPTLIPDLEVISNGPVLSPTQSSFLILLVTREEIKKAIFSMPGEKAPSPDGYNAFFFKADWNVIGEDVYLAIEEFFSSGKLLGTFNSTSITLVPKIFNPKSPIDYRQISCCNCFCKIISTIIVSRIQEVMGLLIGDGQSAFVRDMNISSNILLAHELIKHYGRKLTSPRATLSIDLRKNFDTISWGARGLRQGYPFSLYLFVLGMKYLSRKLNTLKADRLFSARVFVRKILSREAKSVNDYKVIYHDEPKDKDGLSGVGSVEKHVGREGENIDSKVEENVDSKVKVNVDIEEEHIDSEEKIVDKKDKNVDREEENVDSKVEIKKCADNNHVDSKVVEELEAQEKEDFVNIIQRVDKIVEDLTTNVQTKGRPPPRSWQSYSFLSRQSNSQLGCVEFEANDRGGGSSIGRAK